MVMQPLPDYQTWLRERLNWLERLRRKISPEDEPLDFMCMILLDIAKTLRAQIGAAPVDYTPLINSISNLTLSVNQLITQLGGEAAPEIVRYEIEQIRRETGAIPTIAPHGSEVLWQTPTVEKGSVAWIKIISSTGYARYKLAIDEFKAITFDVSELYAYSVEHPYPLGAWVEKANGTWTTIISGWGFDGFPHDKRFVLSAENRGSNELNIVLLEILRRRAK